MCQDNRVFKLESYPLPVLKQVVKWDFMRCDGCQKHIGWMDAKAKLENIIVICDACIVELGKK